MKVKFIRVVLVCLLLASTSHQAWAEGTRNISILGAVNSPGNYTLNDNQTIYDAIAKAGGFSNVANRKKVKIVREDASGREKAIVIDFRKDVVTLKDQESMELDKDSHSIQEGDLVFISKSKVRQAGEIFKSALTIVSLGAMTGAISGAVD